MTVNGVKSDTNVHRITVGPSGARIVISDKVTFKYDTDETNSRVREQGIWLQTTPVRGIKSAPEVFSILPDGYEMETLHQDVLTEINVEERVRKTLHVLRDQWWSEKPTGPSIWIGDHLSDFSPRAHTRYVARLARLVNCRDLVKPLGALCDRIDWHDLERGLTHGDPIVDNTLWRAKTTRFSDTPVIRQLVLIDPIPPTVVIPSLVCVDVGRLIQSVVGYEQARYGVPSIDPVKGTSQRLDRVNDLLNEALVEFNLNEARAALYWSVIHMMRGVRTARLSLVKGEVRTLVYTLMDYVVKPWMR